MQPVSDSFFHGNALISGYQESEGVLGADLLRVSAVQYVKRYRHSFINGVAEAQLQYKYRKNGQVEFTGYEIFSGAVGERRGSLVFDISGSVSPVNNLSTGRLTVSHGSGSTELYQCSGEGSFVMTSNSHYSFEFTLFD